MAHAVILERAAAHALAVSSGVLARGAREAPDVAGLVDDLDRDLATGQAAGRAALDPDEEALRAALGV